MKNITLSQINDALSESLFIDDAVGTMRGLSAMIQEFMNGNTWPGTRSDADPAEKYFMERLTDILFFTYRTLDLTAESTQKQYIELEQKLMSATSCEADSKKGGE